MANPLLNVNIDKTTFLFSIKGTDTLWLDKYEVLDMNVSNRPCVLFVFGGGFVNGERDSEQNAAYMRELAKRGYVAVAIDYRLGMKNAQNEGGADPMKFVSMLQNTIFMAVEDLFDATNFVYNHAEEWNIDKKQIIANGSSAGAITVLQGEYFICNQTEGLTKKLPVGFNYGGVIAFAGAVFSFNGDLIWSEKPAPIQFFHGDADRNVPFDKLVMGDMGVYGSRHIAGQFDDLQHSYYLYKVINAAHEISGNPMTNNLNEIDSFIRKFVVNKQPLIINTTIKQIGNPEMNKNFTILDFIQSNYP